MGLSYTSYGMQKNIVLIRNAARQDFGGGERFPVHLAEELQKHGFSPILLSGSEKTLLFAKARRIRALRSWWWSQQSWSGKRSLLVPLYGAWLLLLFWYYLLLFLRLKPFVVHIQSKDDFIAATFAARLFGARVIWTDHADLKHIWKNVSQTLRNPVGKMVLFTARLAHVITLVSHSEQTLIDAEIGRTKICSKFVVIHNGALDHPKLFHSRAHQEHPVRFCYAGRIVRDKGIYELIAAYRQVHREYPETSLDIFGDGPESSALQSASEDLPINFHGHLDDPLPHIANCDVFLHPTYHEGFSIALVEANMLGLAVIATNVGGNPEIIQSGKNGILVPAKDSDCLADAMLSLIVDRELLMKYGREARKRFVEDFEFQNIVTNQFIPLYNSKYEN